VRIRHALLGALLAGSVTRACPPEAGASCDSVFDLVTGQIPVHGETFWTQRETRLDTRLWRNVMDSSSRLGLAEAREALGRRAESLSVLDSMERILPGSPGGAAVRSHVFEECGNHVRAAELLAAARRADPDVCPGLGDFHLRALLWSASPFKEQSFLGERYSTWPAPRPLSADHYARLLALASRRPRFPDAMLVLGDELCRRGAPTLAIWAWVRALELGHPVKDEIRRRLEATFFLWRLGPGRAAAHVDYAIASIQRYLSRSECWLARFQRVEGQLVLEGSEPDFPAILAECTKRGIRKLTPGDCDEFPVPGAELAAALPTPDSVRPVPAPLPALDPWTEAALRTLAIAAGTLVLAFLAAFVVSRLAPRSPRKSRSLTLSRFAQRVTSKRRGPPMFGGCCSC
jgi:hypothetical protein